MSLRCYLPSPTNIGRDEACSREIKLQRRNEGDGGEKTGRGQVLQPGARARVVRMLLEPRREYLKEDKALQPRVLSRVGSAENGNCCSDDLKTAITSTNQHPKNNKARLPGASRSCATSFDRAGFWWIFADFCQPFSVGPGVDSGPGVDAAGHHPAMRRAKFMRHAQHAVTTHPGLVLGHAAVAPIPMQRAGGMTISRCTNAAC